MTAALDHGIYLFLRLQVSLLAVNLVQGCTKRLSILFNISSQCPVFLTLKRTDFILSLDDQT